MTRLLLAALLLTACGGTTTGMTKTEICNNGKDDDGNGKTDCEDADCSGQAGCPVTNTDAGYYGKCSTCGKACTNQQACLIKDLPTDFPPFPECVAGRCQLFSKNVQIHFEVDTPGLIGFMPPLNAMNTRFIAKKAVDGSAVNCLRVSENAGGKTVNDAAQLERPVDGGVSPFNFRGYDVSPVNASGGQIIKQPYVNVSTGDDYLIWVEIWGGKPDTLTKLPTGNRYVWGCIESGVAVDPVVESDNCSTAADAGPCRTTKVKITNQPQ